MENKQGIVAASRSEYLLWANDLRIFATIAVVSLHVAARLVIAPGSISSTNWWVANIIDSGTRWAVPVFVMLSGLLLLDPHKNESIAVFLSKRFKRIAVPLLIWSATYFFWVKYVRKEDYDFLVLIKRIVRGNPYLHLYFLFLLSGLYIFTPILRVFVQQASREQVKYFLCLTFLFSMMYQAIEAYEGGSSSLAVSMFIPFVGYYVAGSYLGTEGAGIVSKRLLWFLLGCSITICALLTGMLVEQLGVNSMSLFLYEYLSPVVVTMSLCVFCIALRGLMPLPDSPKGTNLRRKMSSMTFGIYLVHPIFVDVLHKQFGIDGLWNSALIGIPFTTLLVLLLSALFVGMTQQTRLGKVIF